MALGTEAAPAGWEAAPIRAHARSDEVHVWRLGAREDPLRRVLARYLGKDPARIALRVGDHGKPALAAADPPLRFNLSHSGDRALVAVTLGHEVGVDIERIRERRDLARLAGRALDREAADAVRAAPPGARAATFYAAWVRREAMAKCFGVGLGKPLPEAPASVSQLDVGGGCAAAVAVTGSAPLPLRRFALDRRGGHAPPPCSRRG